MKRKLLLEKRLYCKKGKHKDKPLGKVLFYENQEPYYYIMKRSSSDQLFRLPKYYNLLAVSTSIIDDLKNLKVEKMVFLLCLGKDSFFIAVSRKDFENGDSLNFDDPQKAVNFTNYPRHYAFPEGLIKWMEN